MITSKIAQLSESDLNYLDNLLHKEFAKQCNIASQWRTKNGYTDLGNRTDQLRRLIDAVNSQKRVSTMPKW